MQAWANIKRRWTRTYITFQDERPRSLNLSLDVVPLLQVCGMYIGKRKKAKRKGCVESDVCFLQTLVSHLTRTSSPHKAFGSYQKLTLLLQNVSEKRK